MNRMLLCSGVAIGLVLLTGQFPRSEPNEPAPQASPQACDQDPAVGYTASIHGLVDGDELSLRISRRFGGSVESVTWRGKEFINTWDHGREISYAWWLDDGGDCLNPTEPGSSRDYKSKDSTSRLLEVCRPAENTLTIRTQPAFWLSPDEADGQGRLCSTVIDSPLTDQVIQKTIQIGYRGLDNVIAFSAVLTLPESHRSTGVEIPTGYLTYEFNRLWRYDPRSGELTRAVSDPITGPWAFQQANNLPPILSTQDGAYAMGAYSDESIQEYGIYRNTAPDPRDRTNKWNIVVREQPAPAGTYAYRSFVIVGTLKEVQAAMTELYHMHPVDFNPPSGFIDVVSCDEIAGWAWDPKARDQAVAVEFYTLESDGSETFLARVSAANFRQDLAAALGDNGKHGFDIQTSHVVPDNRPVRLKAYAMNSDPALPARLLANSNWPLTCPKFGAPVPTHGAPSPTEAAHGATEPAAPAPLPCLGALGPAAVGVLLRRTKRN